MDEKMITMDQIQSDQNAYDLAWAACSLERECKFRYSDIALEVKAYFEWLEAPCSRQS